MLPQVDTPDIAQSLAACDLFGGLTQQEAARLIPLCSMEHWREGWPVFAQGSEASTLYIILSGGVQITLQRDPLEGARPGDRTMVVDTVGSGRVIGWSALVEPYVYTAGARALAGTMALAFDGRGLRALMERDVDVGSKVNKRLIQMLGRRLMQVYGVLDSLL